MATAVDERNLPTVPSDVPGEIREWKRMVRERMGGQENVEHVFQRVSDKIEYQVEKIEAARAAGEPVWPEINYADLESGKVSQNILDQLHERGVLVVREHFPREVAQEWDGQLVDYVEENNFDEIYRGPGDDFFGTLAASRPEIYPIYWSRPQMQARQDKRMATVQSFLNRLWEWESEGTVWFNPDQDTMYPDRIRRRPPGTNSSGLGAHTDSGALERWLLPSYQKVFRHILDGNPDAYNPWAAAHRPEVDEYADGTTMCSVFRTFQGWTALSDMNNDQGVLHTVPIPEAMAYVLLRPLMTDVPEDELCGVTVGRVLPISEEWHPLLMRALTPIPDLQAGDSVWWHADVIHSVAPVEDQEGWGNVMYIPAAPMCEKNRRYARLVAEDFRAGRSPRDFPEEDYEVGWTSRFEESELNEVGEYGLGIRA